MDIIFKEHLNVVLVRASFEELERFRGTGHSAALFEWHVVGKLPFSFSGQQQQHPYLVPSALPEHPDTWAAYEIDWETLRGMRRTDGANI